MASGKVIDSYKYHESTDTKPFLQLFPSGHLLNLVTAKDVQELVDELNTLLGI
jgi:hypothetical protein